MIRLVLADLDATLVWTPERVITPFALAAVHRLQEAGVRFAPCTGRVRRFFPQMFAGDLDACATAVTSNGQLIYLDGELVEETPFSREALQHAREAIREIPDAYFVVEHDDQKVALDVDLDYVQAHTDNFWRVESALDELPDELCYKANVRVVGSCERCEEVALQLCESVPELDFVRPAPGLPHIDVVPAGFGKDHGAAFLAERLGLAPEEVAVFGDAENDLAVFGRFPNSVAVANAVPAVAEAARWHIGPADEDSVARAFLDIAESAAQGTMPSFMR